MMTKLEALAGLGQSVWLDYIRRSFITAGDLKRLVDLGLRGVTSNPTIFQKAIIDSMDYDEDLQRMVDAGLSAEEIYYGLVVADIRQAADLLRPVYEHTNGQDGFVSLEVDPTLARDTQATITEARHLWEQVDRPNLMVKIPATEEGLPAITESIAAGININVTLIFSLERYARVMAAYIEGLEKRRRSGQPVDRIASVASFFVSRVDTKIDRRLEAIIRMEDERSELAAKLLGQAAVANAKMAYQQFKTVFLGEQFAGLRAHGAQIQRPLWASTSTKNPDYSDVKYVEELIAPHTVNTMPQDTLEAFLDHGEARVRIEDDLDETRFVLQSLEDLGVSMTTATDELEDEGVEAFAKSFEALMTSIAEKRNRLVEQRRAGRTPTPAAKGGRPGSPVDWMAVSGLGDFAPAVDAGLRKMAGENILARIWEKDYRVWQPDPDEVSNRLGWLDLKGSPNNPLDLAAIADLVESVRADGYAQAVLLGMGGSSLAPDLFSRTFPHAGGLSLTVLDSTHPEAVLAVQEQIDPLRTLFTVSTKSGSTVETLSLFKYFYSWTAAALGEDLAGEHFIAITDPGSRLSEDAVLFRFRRRFQNDPNIGGRYSALSHFGLVPAALSGVDIRKLLDRALMMQMACSASIPAAENPAARLGTLLAVLAQQGRDKVTFVLSDAIASFGNWVEQLIAESLGKDGQGILPVVGEPLGVPAVYGRDRLFVQIRLAGEDPGGLALKSLEDSGFPVVRIELKDRYDLGGQFLLWELAAAIAGYHMGIHPFNQPNVESAKVRARQMTGAYQETGELPQESPVLSEDGISVYAQETITGAGTEWVLEAGRPAEVLAQFLSRSQPGDYLALQAFLQPTPDTTQALQSLRLALRDRYHLATTLGYGPRFLHSTGQLHKGDAGNGVFIQFTGESLRDVPIPDKPGEEASSAEETSSLTFGVLILAQALGDRQALLDAGRRVMRFHFTGDPAEKLKTLEAEFRS